MELYRPGGATRAFLRNNAALIRTTVSMKRPPLGRERNTSCQTKLDVQTLQITPSLVCLVSVSLGLCENFPRSFK